ncbi:hypothetical protein V8E54_006184 [Elaphomyces granulatus]|jgi:hypothetical protein
MLQNIRTRLDILAEHFFVLRDENRHMMELVEMLEVPREEGPGKCDGSFSASLSLACRASRAIPFFGGGAQIWGGAHWRQHCYRTQELLCAVTIVKAFQFPAGKVITVVLVPKTVRLSRRLGHGRPGDS